MTTAPSHMAREVAEIPEAAARFLDGSGAAVAEAARALRLADPRLLATAARGSSDHAATYLAYAAALVAGLPVASLGLSVGSVYGRALRLDGALCLGVSQSGRSPDVVEVLQRARDGGALTVALTNDEDSSLARAAAHCLPLRVGLERSVPATKTFVASVLAGLALLAAWRDDEGLAHAVQGAPEALGRALALDWSPLGERLAGASSAFVLGRGPTLAVAGEAALKLKETSALHAEAFSAAEVLHGPAALVGPGFPVLALAVDDAARAGIAGTAARLAGQGANVLLAGAEAPGATTLPTVDGLHPLLAPLALGVAFYREAEALARRRCLDPDRPRSLAKVTETR